MKLIKKERFNEWGSETTIYTIIRSPQAKYVLKWHQGEFIYTEKKTTKAFRIYLKGKRLKDSFRNKEVNETMRAFNSYWNGSNYAIK